MEQWKKCKIRDIVEVNAAQYTSKDNWEKALYLDTGNITENKIDEMQEFDCSSLPSRARRKVKHGDIIFSTVRPNQKHYGYITNPVPNLLVSTGFAVISVNQELANSKFIYYWLSQDEIVEYLHNIAEQSVSAYPSIKASDICNLEIKLPPLEYQSKVASILSTLENKISLNHRINGNLEQQAQALYAKAFSSTNTCKMGDVVETTSGGTPSRKNQNYFSSQGIKWIKSKELNGSFIFDSEEHISNDGLCNSSAKLLPPNSTLIAMYGATVGAYGLTIDNATCNQAICALLPNSQYPYTYLYMWAKNNKDELIQKAIGSAQQNISQIIIKNMPVANEKDKIIRFDSDTRYIFSLMRSLAKENYNLIALRDALLPRLMSGELKFNDLNR